MECLKEATGDEAWSSVRCVATDGADCFDQVLSSVLPGVPRIRCLWHILENVKKHLQKPLGQNWREFQTAFRNIYSRMRTEGEFNQNWDALLEKYPITAKYLKKELWGVRHRWVSFWTMRYTTFGAKSTQRVESINRLVKYFHKPDFPLEHLFDTLIEIFTTQDSRRKTQLYEDQFTNHRHSGPVYREATQCVTRYAAEYLHLESINASNYYVMNYGALPTGVDLSPMAASSTRSSYIPPSNHLHNYNIPTTCQGDTMNIPQSNFSHTNDVSGTYLELCSYDKKADGDGAYLVRSRIDSEGVQSHWVVLREDGPASCTDCLWSNNWLLPCRHIFAANLARWPQSSMFRPTQCHTRWLLASLISISSSQPSSSPLSQLSTDEMPITEMEMNENSLYREWMAAAVRVATFMKPHGEKGLKYAMNTLMELVNHFADKNTTAQV
jgi:hypothetical protein